MTTYTTAEFKAAVEAGLPAGYYVSRKTPPARSMSKTATWVVEGHGWSTKRDESPALLPEHLIREAVAHAEAAPVRAERAVIAEAQAAVEAAHRQQLNDLSLLHGPRATANQIDYILKLLAARERSGEGGGFMAGPTDRAGIERMSFADASAYIDSLKGQY